MRRVSTKEAARRFHQLLKSAEEEPVLIECHGRPRAAILSARDLEIVQWIIERHKTDAATELLEGALEKIAAGHFNKALKLRNAALLLGGIIR